MNNLKYCKNCKYRYLKKFLNNHEYVMCSLFDKSIGKVFEDLQIILYDWECLK
jgi:hypothetical protein